MESLMLNVRVNANDKKELEEFCNSVGMNVSTAINMFIKAVIRDKKLPFEVTSKSNEEMIYEKLKEAEVEMELSSKRYSKEEILKNLKYK